MLLTSDTPSGYSQELRDSGAFLATPSIHLSTEHRLPVVSPGPRAETGPFARSIAVLRPASPLPDRRALIAPRLWFCDIQYIYIY